VEVQADEGGEDGAVARGAVADDAADDGLGARARPRVEAELQLLLGHRRRRRGDGGLHRAEHQQKQQQQQGMTRQVEGHDDDDDGGGGIDVSTFSRSGERLRF
jgi:hypothetical protein